MYLNKNESANLTYNVCNVKETNIRLGKYKSVAFMRFFVRKKENIIYKIISSYGKVQYIEIAEKCRCYKTSQNGFESFGWLPVEYENDEAFPLSSSSGKCPVNGRSLKVRSINVMRICLFSKAVFSLFHDESFVLYVRVDGNNWKD